MACRKRLVRAELFDVLREIGHLALALVGPPWLLLVDMARPSSGPWCSRLNDTRYVSSGANEGRDRRQESCKRAAGLPIASGAVEGARKQLLKDCMERSGMRWTEDGGTSGAETMLKLRTAYLSRDFEEY